MKKLLMMLRFTVATTNAYERGRGEEVEISSFICPEAFAFFVVEKCGSLFNLTKK